MKVSRASAAPTKRKPSAQPPRPTAITDTPTMTLWAGCAVGLVRERIPRIQAMTLSASIAPKYMRQTASVVAVANASRLPGGSANARTAMNPDKSASKIRQIPRMAVRAEDGPVLPTVPAGAGGGAHEFGSTEAMLVAPRVSPITICSVQSAKSVTLCP